MKRLTILLALAIVTPVQAGDYVGDYNAGDTVYCYFNTYQPSTGASFTLASGTLAATKDGSATEDTDGLTLDNDFDAVTGRHQVEIDTSADGTFYSAGSQFSVYLTAGTVDSVSVVGSEVCSFSILDGTLATIDGNVDSVLADTGTDGVAVATGAINAAAIADDAIDAGAIAANAIGSSEIATSAIGADEIATNAIGASEIATDAIGSAEIAADAIGAPEIAASAIGSSEIATAAIGEAELAADAITASEIATDAVTEIVANVSVDEIQATALADLFNTDSGTTYGSAVAGSVVSEIADNSGGSALTAAAIVDEWETQSQADPTGFHVNVIEVGGTGQTANDNGADINAILVDTGTTIPGQFPTNFGDLDIEATTGHVDVGYWNGSEITTALETAADIADAVLDEDLTAHQTTGSLGAAIGDGDNGAGLTAVPWNSAWDTEVQSEADDAIVANHLDHLLAADYDPASKPGTATALLNEIVENDSGVSRFTTNVLENAPSGGGGSSDWSTSEREEIRGRLGITGTTAAGGNTPTLALEATIAALNDLSAAQVNAEVDTALSDYDPPTRAELTSDIAGLNDLSAAAVNAEVDTALSDYDAPTRAELASDIASLNDLDAAGVRTAIGLASANLDTQIAALPTASEITTDILAATIDGTINLQCSFALMLAYSSGKWTTSGSVVTYRNPGDTANRIVGTIASTSFDSITRTCP